MQFKRIREVREEQRLPRRQMAELHYARLMAPALPLCLSLDILLLQV